MQIRAGTGGDEACAVLRRPAAHVPSATPDEQSWKLSFLSESVSENGGLKEAIVQVSTRV